MDLDTFAAEYNEAWNQHDVDKVVAYFADDGVLDDVASGHLTRGRESVGEAVSEWLTAFPDMRSKMGGRCVSGGHAVAYEWRLKATNRGPFMGHGSTGRSIDFRGIALVEVDEQGKITRHADYVNLATILTQLGHL